MRIVVGLGNPGRKYLRTRHNAGFMVVDQLASSISAEFNQEKHNAFLSKVKIDSEGVVLAKPQTYMNDSGRAVAAILRDTYSTAADLVVVHDELDLPLGSVRVKIGGGHGGHNGLRSMIELIGTSDFIRVRLGVGRPAAGQDAAAFVLSPFAAEERSTASEAVNRAAEAVRAIIIDGPVRAMNMFNKQ